MSRPSSATRWTRTEDCFCHEQLRHSLSPKRSYEARISSSADICSACGSVQSKLVTQQHLLERVGTQPEPKRLERDHLFGRNVPEVDLGTELPHEPGLRG